MDMLSQPNLKIGLCSYGIARRININAVLNLKNPKLKTTLTVSNCDLYIGWGRKKSGTNAVKFAQKTNANFLLIEDSFVRSYAPRSLFGEHSYGLVLDDRGIYYDANQPSRLEQLIIQSSDILQAEQEGQAIIANLTNHKICKYNNFKPLSANISKLVSNGGVLVIDQTFQDQSITGAKANARSFSLMLEAAIDENIGQEIFVKLHPEVMAGKKRGYLKKLAERYHCTILTENFNPWDFFPFIQKVYTVSSQLGFDALMAGCQVNCFGQPFYSGWGLTRDHIEPHSGSNKDITLRRCAKPTINQVAFAAYHQYARYLEPYDRTVSDINTIIPILAHIRDTYNKNRCIESFYQVTPWKRKRIKKMFKPHGSSAWPGKKLFFSNPEKAIAMAKKRHGSLVAWSSRIDDTLQAKCAKQKVPLLRLEDGFVRSVGLGANFNLPMSLIIDGKGIYYDPRQPSDLEHLLETHTFTAAEKQRAANLRRTMIDASITKYNLSESSQALSFPHDKQLILVPGQVDNDASIKLGGNNMTAMDILSQVRRKNRNAHIIFKPHPDVVSGQRPGLLDKKQALQFADYFAEGISIEHLMTRCDEVHTISSLTGFEALMRGKKVSCYGIPFYAGWGLTQDMERCPRRTRTLSLDELVAGTLIMYPRYFDPISNLPCGPELVIKRIQEERITPAKPSIFMRSRSAYGKIKLFFNNN